ncbi:ParA family protein [Clostridium sp. YIM B02555]|uniref:ParA family protein n=1 Tax=Clostridium sp. YIM B02555 TaxID=2911968 RepID=UPI001EEDC169|nr:ParA family protein [Clostridium sp. YIM B02555]
MKVISFLNIKGGVAKTTSCVNVAACLGQLGYEVLVIDSDPQANATSSLGMYNSEGIGMYELLKGEEQSYIKKTIFKDVYLIPSNIKLIASEGEILADTKKPREIRLRKWMNRRDRDFDFILIDCPPSLGMLTTNALAITDYVLVPIKIDKYALDGFEYLLSVIDEARENLNVNLRFLGAFATMDKRTKVNKEIKKDLKNVIGEKFFEQTVRENADVIKSTFEFQPVVYFNPKSNASNDYKELTKEIVSCLI